MIGVVVGTVVVREVGARARSARRGREVAVLAEVARSLSREDAGDLVRACTDGICELLGLRSCEWAPGFRGTIHHELTRDGSITDWAGPGLPEAFLEVPVSHGGRELGRLILRSSTRAPVSSEERRTVVAIADLLGAGLGHRG